MDEREREGAEEGKRKRAVARLSEGKCLNKKSNTLVAARACCVCVGGTRIVCVYTPRHRL